MYSIQKRPNGSGSASSFYRLKNSRKGFKAFSDYHLAKVAHYNQSALSEYDLAPRVYSEVGRVRIDKSNRLSKWGYITEIAQLVCCPGNDCDCCDRNYIEEGLEDEINNLTDEMYNLGFYFSDNHSGNVGYVVRNGERLLVCIDTGDESVQNEDGPCVCIECLHGRECCA